MGFDAETLRRELVYEQEYLRDGLQEAYYRQRENKDPALRQGNNAVVVMWQAKCYTFNDLLAKLLVSDAIDDDDLACLTVSLMENRDFVPKKSPLEWSQ